MTKDDGHRRRLWSERKKVEYQQANPQGSPLHSDVGSETRSRVFREAMDKLANCVISSGSTMKSVDRRDQFFAQVATKLGSRLQATILCEQVDRITIDEFLDFLELAADTLWLFRRTTTDIDEINSLLADDLSAFRIRNVGSQKAAEYHIHHIDNAHLHGEIVDRTFELTTLADFASAQHDYAEAWKHHSKGELGKAIFHAAKALESAYKAVIKKWDSSADVQDKSLNALALMMMQLDIIPSQFQSTASAINTIVQNSGVLRNVPGIGHGSLEVENLEASLSLLALRMSGTMLSFVAARWLQVKPTP